MRVTTRDPSLDFAVWRTGPARVRPVPFDAPSTCLSTQPGQAHGDAESRGLAWRRGTPGMFGGWTRLRGSCRVATEHACDGVRPSVAMTRVDPLRVVLSSTTIRPIFARAGRDVLRDQSAFVERRLSKGLNPWPVGALRSHIAIVFRGGFDRLLRPFEFRGGRDRRLRPRLSLEAVETGVCDRV